MFSGPSDTPIRGGDGSSSERDSDEASSNLSSSEEESSPSSNHWESSGHEDSSEPDFSGEVMDDVGALIGDSELSEEGPSDSEVWILKTSKACRLDGLLHWLSTFCLDGLCSSSDDVWMLHDASIDTEHMSAAATQVFHLFPNQITKPVQAHVAGHLFLLDRSHRHSHQKVQYSNSGHT